MRDRRWGYHRPSWAEIVDVGADVNGEEARRAEIVDMGVRRERGRCETGSGLPPPILGRNRRCGVGHDVEDARRAVAGFRHGLRSQYIPT